MKEQARLAALSETKLLDSAPDPRFDRLTRLAANSLETEVALVSLIDADRQWFKSCYGLNTTETSRDVAFCEYAIRGNDVMVVLDASKDIRFADNPLVTGDPFIRFYAGAPLVTKDGHALGTLCVIDPKPRESFDETDKQILRDLADGVMVEIQADARKRQVRDLSVINRELEHRMGNMYAHVSSLISLLDKSDVERDEFVRRLRDKINTLAETQSLLAMNEWQSVSIRELAIKSLSPFEPEPDQPLIAIQDKDDFHITARAAFAMSLLLNELGTNSVKHGALGSTGGRATFGWTQGDLMQFYWQEKLIAPREAREPGNGFGSMILKRIVPKTFGGEAIFDIQPESFNYSVTALPDRVRMGEEA
ncbi:GAF domain-containing protein [Henriciella sp. AS95]|uniref:GAF domain-containing protein n=1 Tax=Henriciella sp. AS95 TaxID=3135782 RepID=UPI00317EBAD8